MVLFIENYNHYLRIYYADGHHEVIDQSLQEYACFCKQKNKYKNPIMIGKDCLYPTQNMRDADCKWVNFHCLDEKNIYLMNILKERNILQKVVNEYIYQKKKQFMENEDSIV